MYSRILILMLLTICVSRVFAEEAPVYILAPENYISDFPNERISIQSRQLTIVSEDIVIPGNSGMDIVVTRRQNGDEVTFDNITFSTSIAYNSVDPQYSLSCLGDFKRISVRVNGQRLSSAGYDSPSQYPSNAFALFDNGAYFKCDGIVPVLYFPNGRKYTFTPILQQSTDFSSNVIYAVDSITDRYGNYIIYEYENDEMPHLKKRLKSISRNDGQVVNFFYNVVDAGSFSYSLIKEIVFSGQKVQYEFNNRLLTTFTDAQGRKTTYTYGMVTGLGNIIRSITTPEGLVATYYFAPYTAAMGPRVVSSEMGENGGYLVSKSISGPGIPLKWYSYDSGLGNTSQEYKTLVYQINYKNELDLTTEYTIETRRGSNSTGQIKKIRRFEGYFTIGEAHKYEYVNHNVIYEQINTWEKINTEEFGCHDATKNPLIFATDCSRYEISKIKLSIKNNGVFDNYVTDIIAFNAYGQPLTTTESFGTNYKVTSQSYDHDIERWILNQPRITRVGKDFFSLIDTKEITYYAKNHANYPFMPYEEKSFGTWQKRYVSYFTDGSVKKFELNALLADNNAHRYQRFENYYRGQPQRIISPERYSSNEIAKIQRIDDFGRIIESKDLNGNTINYGYDKIGRLSYIDPADPLILDTLIEWSNNGGVDNNQPLKIETRCRLNSAKTACSGEERLKTATLYDAKLRVIQVKTTDVINNISRYENFSYNPFDRKTFTSFPSNNANETSGTHYTYDGLQRLTQTRVDNGGIQTVDYLVGNKQKVTDFNGNETTTTYLAYGTPSYEQAIKIESPESVTTDIDINIFGNVTRITQSGAHKNTTISQTQINLYNAQQQLCMVKRNDVGNTYYARNNLGEVTWQAQGVSGTSCSAHGATAAQKVSFGYDNLGNQRTISYGDGLTPTVTYTLDNNGDIKTLTSGNVSQSYHYNSARLLEDETLSIDGKSFTLDYEYDGLGNLFSLTYPSTSGIGTVNFAPNAFGQATKASRVGNNYATGASYYANGILDTFTYGNGIRHKTTLNNRNMPEQIRDYKGTTNKVKLSYTYDYQNNVKSIIDSINPSFSLTNLTYDGLNRLTSTTGGVGIGSSTMVYDALGNITSYSNTSNVKSSNLTYTYNTSTNKLTGVSGNGAAGYDFSQSNSYDNRGNVTHNGMRSFTYNLANQMIQSGSNRYVYDGYNRRVKTQDSKGTSYSMYSQSGKLLYREVNNDPISYIFLGDKLIAKEGVMPINNDSRMHYKPFGDSIEPAKDEVGYTGHKFDTDLGLSYMQARYYDPVIGRFYSNDPVGFIPSNPMSFNRYLYVNNNPYKYTDPDGEFLQAIIGAAIGAVAEIAAQKIGGADNINWTKVGVSAVAGAITGGVSSVYKGAFTATASAVEKGAASMVVAGTAATAGGGSSAINSSIDGNSSQQITQDAAIGAVLSVTGPGKATGAAAGQKVMSAFSAAGKEANTMTKSIEGVVSGTVSNVVNEKVSNDVKDRF